MVQDTGSGYGFRIWVQDTGSGSRFRIRVQDEVLQAPAAERACRRFRIRV
jgi:hypothetical protein